MAEIPEPSQTVTSEVAEMITAQRLCYVATVTPDGRPNLSPKGSLKVLDAQHLAFAEMASPNTIANLRQNAHLEINVVDPFLRRGYRIKGTGEIRHDPDLLALVGAGLGHDYPVRAAVHITVSEVRGVYSPVYLFTDASSDEIAHTWEGIYGYRRVDT